MSLTSPFVAMLNGLAIVYVPFLIFSTVASAPSMLTAFTVSSKAYITKFNKISKNISVTQEGCPEFCTMIETGWETHKDRYELLKNHIDNLSKEADTLILGCTHYPIIREDIEKYFSGKIVDPARETALELYSLLKLSDSLNTSDKKGRVDFFVSGNKERFKKVAEKFLGFEIKNIYSV